ncbi:MAG: 4Fe-4S cluster-binding domain-containing protein [Planctomycetes bacterium]|nr:4Fe-4S cluster-binding domain-containing protein [Planctomycetota bacterium]
MKELHQNKYNRSLRPDEAKFKLWRYMGLLLTYKCSATCKFCYYNCSPDTDGVMAEKTALDAWKSLKNLAGRAAKVHITGGEPFLYWKQLKNLLIQAEKLNLGPVNQIETNASWAVNREIVVERVKILDGLGMEHLKISCDPFHAEFVDTAAVKLLAETAAEVLGPARVLLRWQKYLDSPVNMRNLTPLQRQRQYKLTMQIYPFRFTGRAAAELGHLFATQTADDLRSADCRLPFLSAKGVHIDPLGNVFSGLCSGVIIGNINQNSLEEIWRRCDWNNDEFTATLFNRGPAGFLEKAVKSGYKKRRFYTDKCHLCTDLRQFFFDRKQFTSIIGPVQCYQH